MSRKIITLYPTSAIAIDDNTKESIKARVAAYCRVSSASDEQLHSVKAQVDYYKEFITSNPDYEFIGIYADEGISGTLTLKRDAFNRMIEDCRNGLIDMVVTKSVSRFGRNTVDTLKYVRELKSLGIDVYFEKENIHTLDSEGEVLLTLISAVAQNESLTQSDNVKWGIRRKYENGSIKSVPCGKFLGYDKIDGQLVVNEEQADVIRRIYRDFINGYGFSQIANKLTADGIPSERGNTIWNLSSIRKMLTNEKYKGDTLFQKTYNVDHLTKKRVKNNGELHKYYIENSHQPIVDKDIWECVQQELLRQKQYCHDHHIGTYHRSNEENPLSARIICPVCGSTYMMLKSKRVGEEGRKFWRCSSFIGENGTVIDGRTFTPPPMALWTKNPDSRHAKYRVKNRKLPQERPMLCTDIQIEAGLPEKVFVKACNQLISHRARYLASLNRIGNKTDDLLMKYRVKEMSHFIENGQRLVEFDYPLSLKLLDHIEVTLDGKLSVIFLTGIKITF
ncbi:MAG TPA: recombinase family protein [Pseudobacteroides sp.]|uniref:recombinase family protein n=1 Tax=Pseudobacteroides sp. TaxID=1968840 RepID=UPI002F949268